MDTVTLITGALLICGTFAAAFLALWALARFDGSQKKALSLFMADDGADIVFLFDDEDLVNATPDARQVVSTAPKVGTDWARLLTVLLPRFPRIQDDMAALADQGFLKIQSEDGKTVIRAEWREGIARLALVDVETDNESVDLDKHSLAAMERELETLRATADHAPYLVWRELADGTITWANSAYIDYADQMEPDAIVPSWPPRRLFDSIALGQDLGNAKWRRATMRLPDDETPRHFEIFASKVGSDVLYTAMSAEKTAKAETALRDFMQTLTKTFAHLTIGLAIFDKKRQLALFNPALTDLTGLPVDFLAVRPTLAAFLDRLREKQVFPEPKDYKSWRQQMADLEAAAADGTYEETWALPSGQTYRVTGRPHPDGAVAFLFEDISAEMSLTRKFRAELEAGQAILDTMDEAVALFSSTGVLKMTNRAYDTLWAVEPADTLGEVGIADATRQWHARCAPSPIWGDVRDFIGSFGERAEWKAETRLWDGRRLACRFVPMAGGDTLIGFTPIAGAITRRVDPRPPVLQAQMQAEL